ncbi:hypothetical protein BB561_004426 [Smittium simulii]|uniref:SP-RING-type domain-containing protein n=1 Tax=Smittium simulii TaxID=133385 RepID=A0A2T9YGC5_9FUNG|nr:hypothetical protein BB561_004426 [Smittium simulii]
MDERIILNQIKEIKNQSVALQKNISRALDDSILAVLDLIEVGHENGSILDQEKCVKEVLDDLSYHSIFLAELQKLENKNTIDNKDVQKFKEIINKNKLNYDNASDIIKYGDSQKYKEFKTQVWEITNPGEPMPSIFEEDEDEDIIIASSTVGFKCPLTTMYLVEPMTSKKCNHNYSKSSITEFLRRETKPCPVTGCGASVSMSDLYENKILDNRVQRHLRVKRQKELKKYTMLK